MKKKRGRNTKVCGCCRDPDLEAPFCSGAFHHVCLPCKVAQGASNLAAEDKQRQWSECNPQGQPYFVTMLGLLLPYEGQITTLFGEDIVQNNRTRFDALFAFAHKESFSDEDFALVRFERALKAAPEAMDFWLSLCCAFDLGNYLEDYGKWSKREKGSKK
jgi:hypothetical protein